MTIADNLTALAEQKLGYKDSVEACKASLENKDVVVPVGAKLADISGMIDEIQQGGGDPSIPVGVGQWLVTFYDFDGKVLKRQRVNTGESATAPAIPTHEFLTFAEWNNPFTNVQSDIDTGAIYNTTDGNTYLFITLTHVTGLAPTLYFSKSSASLMTIDWGDGTTSTSTTSGNQTINHIYATAGDYIITIDNSAGGLWALGQGLLATSILYNYQNTLNKVYIGLYAVLNSRAFNSAYNSIQYISIGNIDLAGYVFNNIYGLTFFVHGGVSATNAFNGCYNIKKHVLKLNSTTRYTTELYSNINITKIICGSSLTSIGASAFNSCYAVTTYIFTSTTPPTLANINAFTGINPICKIYVPDASVEAYKTATNWNSYSSYIYPLSQKPQSNE